MLEKICPECGKEREENEKHCTECGYVFKKVKEEKNTNYNISINQNTNKYITIVLTILYFFGLFVIPVVMSHSSGNLSILHFVKQFASDYDVYFIYTYGLLAVIIALVICLILVLTDKKIFASIIYLLIFIFQIIFAIILDLAGYNFIMFCLIILYAIPLVIFVLLLSNKKIKIPTIEQDYSKKIMSLKTLYDTGAITKEEFEKYKKEILDKEFK